MRKLFVVSAFVLCWGGQTFAQTAPAVTYENEDRNSETIRNGMAWPLSGLTMMTTLLRYPAGVESCGWLAQFQGYRHYNPAPILRPAPAGAAPFFRLTSNRLSLGYRVHGLVIKADIGEYHANRPNARVFLVPRDAGGLLGQIEASAGIGLHF